MNIFGSRAKEKVIGFGSKSRNLYVPKVTSLFKATGPGGVINGQL